MPTIAVPVIALMLLAKMIFSSDPHYRDIIDAMLHAGECEILLPTGAKMVIQGKRGYLYGYAYDRSDIAGYLQSLASMGYPVPVVIR